jgi:hypothetical protein
MIILRRFVWFGILLMFAAAPSLRADVVAMQNGDRYSGKVLSVSDDAVMLTNEVLGKITVPRKKVAGLSFGTNSIALNAPANVAPVSAPTNLPAIPASIVLTNTNVDFSAALRNSSMGTNIIRQIREKMLAGSPEAADKYDELANGLLSGKLNVDDLRREAQASADQLRALKRDLGPDADESLDGYLEVLDGFLKEAGSESATTNLPPKSPAP